MNFKIEVVENIGTNSVALFGKVGTILEVVGNEILNDRESLYSGWQNEKEGLSAIEKINTQLGMDEWYNTVFKLSRKGSDHSTHCCVHHGCKYGDEDCPVTNEIVRQKYKCEVCVSTEEGEYGLMTTVQYTSNSIKNGRTVPSIFLSVTEEIGEIAQEIRVKHMPDCYKEGDVDGILGESCDAMIGLLDLLFVEGYTQEEINETIARKCAKWRSKAMPK